MTNITDNNYFTDITNQIKTVRHSSILTDIEKTELEEKIVEDLCRIFSHNNG